MKCQSKIDVRMFPLGGVEHILIKGNMYECELTPTMYDPKFVVVYIQIPKVIGKFEYHR